MSCHPSGLKNLALLSIVSNYRIIRKNLLRLQELAGVLHWPYHDWMMINDGPSGGLAWRKCEPMYTDGHYLIDGRLHFSACEEDYKGVVGRKPNFGAFKIDTSLGVV